MERVNGDKAKTDNTFNVLENGEKVTYETTPELIQTMRMLDREQSNMVAKIFRIRLTGYALALHYHQNLS